MILWNKTKAMTKTKYFIALVALLAAATACQKHTEIFFDTPFVRIEDPNGQTTMVVDRTLDNLLTEIRVVVSASSNYFSEPLTVEYETIVGDGLQEGVNFKIQPSHRSPITFTPGIYSMPIRVIWYKPEDFDPQKDNTLTLRLTSSSVPEMLMGVPGQDGKRSEFIFKQQ